MSRWSFISLFSMCCSFWWYYPSNWWWYNHVYFIQLTTIHHLSHFIQLTLSFYHHHLVSLSSLSAMVCVDLFQMGMMWVLASMQSTWCVLRFWKFRLWDGRLWDRHEMLVEIKYDHPPNLPSWSWSNIYCMNDRIQMEIGAIMLLMMTWQQQLLMVRLVKRWRRYVFFDDPFFIISPHPLSFFHFYLYFYLFIDWLVEFWFG